MFSGYLLADVGTFGENLRRLRKARGLKAKDIAERLGVTRPVVSKMENDRNGLPETPTLFRLAKAIPATIEDLLAGIDPAYDAIRRELSCQTSTGDSLPGGDVSNDTAAADSSGVLEPDEGPMLEAIRSVRAAIGESMAKLVDVETRLAATRQAVGSKARGTRTRSHR